MSSRRADAAPRLRPSGADDRDFLFRLYASTRAAEMALVDWSEAQQQAFLEMQFHAQTTHYQQHFPGARFDVIELDGIPVGRLYVAELEDEDEIRIIDIALLPDYQGRGIGGAYLREIIERAAASGRGVGIHVERNNPAMKLYERLGFERIHDEGVYWFMRWRAQNDQEKTAS